MISELGLTGDFRFDIFSAIYIPDWAKLSKGGAKSFKTWIKKKKKMERKIGLFFGQKGTSNTG